MHLKHEKIVIH